MSRRTRFVLAGLTATDGQPLQPPTVVQDVPFLSTTSVPVDETQGTATDASSIVIGNFTELLWGVHHDVRITVERESLADDLTYTFLVRLRTDIAVAHPAAFVHVQGITP